MRTAIFYASNTGSTEEIAQLIKKQLGPKHVDTIRDVEGLDVHDLEGYDTLIVGVATWDYGDIPYDWAVLYEGLKQCDFTGTRIAMFGLGDQWGYPETFLDAMGLMYRAFVKRGAHGGYGFWPTRNYTFSGSMARFGAQFCGLAIDQDNEAQLTASRIKKWCAQIKRELGMLSLCTPQIEFIENNVARDQHLA